MAAHLRRVATLLSPPRATTPTSRSSHELDDLLGKLTLASKVRLLTGATFFTLHEEPSIELASMAVSDGPTGARGVAFSSGPRASLLPNATLVAASWSEEILHEVGDLLADEAERQHVHVVLGPTINLHRSPLGGRLFEAFSEDPLLHRPPRRGLCERPAGARHRCPPQAPDRQ